jgi:hypothetical protein
MADVANTSGTLTRDAVDKNYRLTCAGEMEAVWGLKLFITLHKGYPVGSYFRVELHDFDIVPPPALGRWGVTKNRFLILDRYTVTEPGVQPPANCDNPYWFTAPMVRDFNEKISHKYTAGYLCTGDETREIWEGAEGEFNATKSQRQLQPQEALPPRCRVQHGR